MPNPTDPTPRVPGGHQLAAKVRTAREKAGLSLAELAATVGVETFVVDAIEAGTVFPTPTVLAGLSKALSVPVEALVELLLDDAHDG